ncbi:MAG: hypothetical protein SGARI_006285 [Bacillariaceae sp.]
MAPRTIIHTLLALSLIVSSATAFSTPSAPASAEEWVSRIGDEVKEISQCASIVASAVLLPVDKVTAEEIVTICDDLDTLNKNDNLFVTQQLDLRRRALETKRYEYLAKLMQHDYDAYIATASFLSPSRIPRCSH